MTAREGDTRGMAREIVVLLGIPALLVGAIAYSTWPWPPTPYAAATQEAFFETASGVWDWPSDSSCTGNPQRIEFSPDRSQMFLTSRRPWDEESGDTGRTTVYDLSDRSTSHVRGTIQGESRTTDSGAVVVWDLVLTSDSTFGWHRTDWEEGALTAELTRCPAATEALIPPRSDVVSSVLP